MRKQEFVIFDVETTGLSPHGGDRIVEIAALKIKNLTPVDKFYSLIDPEREVSFGAFQVNGITSEMLMGAPKSSKVLPRFMEFIGSAGLVGHNVKFDLNFICHELSILGLSLDEKALIIDTLKLSRNLLPQIGRHPLWLVAQTLGVKKNQKHRAMADVELIYQVFSKLIELAEGKDLKKIACIEYLFTQIKTEPLSSWETVT